MYEELIKINQEEVSSVSTTGTSTRLTAMVIEAGRGPTIPVTFLAGSEDAIKTMFGNPSEEYPHILGAILANRNSNLIISAPDSGGTQDVIYLTPTGLAPAVSASSLSHVEDGESGEAVRGKQVKARAGSSVPVGSMARFFVKYTGKSDLTISISYDSTVSFFTMDILLGLRLVGNYTFSLTKGAKDGYGINMYVDDVLRNNSFIGCEVYTSEVPSSFPSGPVHGSLKGGTRGSLGDTALNLGLTELNKRSSTHIDIFCDVTESAAVYEKFQTWSLGQWPNSTYLVPVPANSVDQVGPWVKDTFKANPKMMIIANRGTYSLVNYNGGIISLSCTADLVRNLVIGNTLFDAAPVAGYVDGRGYGGALTGPLLGLAWELTADQRVTMSKSYVNPIVQDSEVGYLCYSQKSGMKTQGVSDSVPVVRATNYIRRGLINTLKYYIQRWNEPNAIAEIEIKLDNLLSPMVGSTPQIVKSYTIDFSGAVNTPQKMALGILAGKVIVNFNNIIEEVEIQFVITDGSVEVQ